VKKDAHFYVVLAVSRACGFKKESAHRLAYASQFVDDAKINLIYLQNHGLKEGLDNLDDRPAFFNIATCHSYFKVDTFNYEAMVNNTSAFHFVPGCKGKTFTKKLRCREESPIILDILQDALQEDNPIILGLVLHPYADTFAHQGFSGLLSKVNAIKNCRVENELSAKLQMRILNLFCNLWSDKFERYLNKILPAYGHAQALDFPDLPYLVWSHEYDPSDDFRGYRKRIIVDNRERYLRAFKKIKEHLEYYLSLHPQHRDEKISFSQFDLFWDALIYKGKDQARIRNWQKLLLELGLFSEEDKALWTYDDSTWLRKAFVNYNFERFHNRRVEDAQCVENFKSTDWYHFIMAVKWYKRKFYHYSQKHQLSFPS